METENKFENPLQIKEEFKVWLKKFHEQLSNRNEALKSRLADKQKINKELNDQIETLANNSINISTLAIDVVPNKVQTQVEESVNNLKARLDQLSKCNESINDQVEEETRKLHNKYFDMITKDDISLKPFHEVEEAIKELKGKTDSCITKSNEDKEAVLKTLKGRQLWYNEIKEDIAMLEPLESEMRFCIQNNKRHLDEKLRSLKLNSIEEANKDSTESKELLLYISNMKSQLNMQ